MPFAFTFLTTVSASMDTLTIKAYTFIKYKKKRKKKTYTNFLPTSQDIIINRELYVHAIKESMKAALI